VWYILFSIGWQKQNIPHRSNCHKMKNKIYPTVRTVIKWKTKYTTPSEMSSNEKQNIPTFEMLYNEKQNIGAVYLVLHFIAVRTVWYILFFISWQFERCGIFSFSFYNIFERCGIFCFPFDDSSNGVVYFVFHFMTVRTVWYILFFIIWQLNGAVYLKWKDKYTTPFELSWNEKQNIPHRSNCHKMKNKIYNTVRTVIKCVVYFVFHFITVRMVRYI
jgi:hypothetical protein